MTKVVFISPREPGPVIGTYDGYGRIEPQRGGDSKFDDDECNISEMEPFAVYHKACWKLVGEPKKYVSPSPYAKDQGYFTNFNPPGPLTQEELKELSDLELVEKVIDS